MKFNITLAGEYQAQVMTTLDGKGAFTGSIVASEFGSGEITNGVQNGNQLTGIVSLDGYDADFSATLNGNQISGQISYGWFFKEPFNGTAVQT